MADEFEILEQFLSSRGVSQEVTRKLRDENVGIEVLLVMSDDDLQRLGILRYGDRVALRVFCQCKHDTKAASTSSVVPSPVCRSDDLIARLKDKLHRTKAGDAKPHSHLTGNKFATKLSRRLEVGWLDYDGIAHQFRQVRQKSGGGTRKMVVPGSSAMSTVLAFAKELFFPDGKSNKGKAEDFAFEVANFDCNPLDHNVTVEEAYSKSKVKLLRLYLRTEKIVQTSSTSCQSNSTETSCQEQEQDDNLPDLTPPHEAAFTVDTGTPTISFRVRETGHNCVQDLQAPPCMEGTSGSVTSDRASAYTAYINLIDSDNDDTGDENVQSALLASYGLHESVPQSDQSNENEMQRCLAELIRQFSTEYFTGSADEKCTVVVQRRNFIHSVLRAISKPGFNFHKRVRVVFSGEEAEDEGGPCREFFRLLMQSIASEMGLFEGHEQARVFTHNVELLRRDHYRLAGEMTSWSLANGGPGLPCLSSYMFDLWCGSRIANLDGAAEHVYDDTCQRLIKEILAIRSEDQMELLKGKWPEVLLANGIVNVHSFHLRDKCTLAEDLLCNYLQFRISAELTAFSSGLGNLWNVVKTHKNALQPLFLHETSPLSLLQLRKLYCVEWAENGSRRRASQEDSIYFFESFLQECEEKSTGVTIESVLAFWTGATSEPPLGFPAPSILDDWNTSGRPLSISFYEDKGRLPYASTCSLRLWLPIQVEQEQFNHLLKRSLTECVGFGKV